jgi:hypothetical protein
MRLDSGANDFNIANLCNISSNNILDNKDNNIIEVNDQEKVIELNDN